MSNYNRIVFKQKKGLNKTFQGKKKKDSMTKHGGGLIMVW